MQQKYNSNLGNLPFPEIMQKTWQKSDALRELQPRIPTSLVLNFFFSLFFGFFNRTQQKEFCLPIIAVFFPHWTSDLASLCMEFFFLNYYLSAPLLLRMWGSVNLISSTPNP